MKIIRLFHIFIVLSVILTSCSKDETGNSDSKTLVKVDESVSANSLFDIEFLADDSLFVGYNKVYFKITDKGTGLPASNAVISLHPLMDMVTFKHACPFENPGETPDKDGYFEGFILFSMPGYNNSWSLSADVEVNGKSDKVDFSISKVVATTPGKKMVVIDSLKKTDGSWAITKHPVSLVPPASWKVGQNRFEITVHTMASMMSFPCCSEMSVEINPEMPSMGHGSPNNVNPVLTSNGHYVGTVNFTMTGAWRVNMTFKKGDRVIGEEMHISILISENKTG